MTNSVLLRQKIDQSGYKLKFIAKKLGISYQALLNKLTGKSEFRISEIQALRELLNLTNAEAEAIFFSSDVGK